MPMQMAAKNMTRISRPEITEKDGLYQLLVDGYGRKHDFSLKDNRIVILSLKREGLNWPSAMVFD
jgi:hypothetical protein